jgi:hypothetical protein
MLPRGSAVSKADSPPLEDLRSSGTRSQLRQSRVDHFAGGLFTTATAASNRQMLLNIAQRTGSPVYKLSNLSICDRVADANVHGVTQAVRLRVDLNTNANDCQLAPLPDDCSFDSNPCDCLHEDYRRKPLDLRPLVFG